MKQQSYILFFIACFFATVSVSAQTDSVKTKKSKKQIPLDSTFVINNKRFKYYNNWFTVGGGVQQNLTYKRTLGFYGGADFNFHIKRDYFQAGVIMTGEQFGATDNIQLHFGYGKRFEDKDVHVAAFIGPSFSSGFAKVGDSVYARSFNEPGVYIQGEVVKKITYDVGIGLALFLDYNQEQSIFGGRFILYFSGAYRGKKYYDGKEGW